MIDSLLIMVMGVAWGLAWIAFWRCCPLVFLLASALALLCALML